MKQFTKYYPNCEVVECPNSNRMPMIEDYERFNKAVKGGERVVRERRRYNVVRKVNRIVAAHVRKLNPRAGTA